MTEPTVALAPVPAYQHTCQRCGHRWQSPLARPAACPAKKCHNRRWDVAPRTYTKKAPA